MVDPESSFELLVRVRTGDSDALSRLLQRYLPALTRWARGRLPHWARDVSDTQDLVQDTVIQVMKHLNEFRPERPGALQAYLRQALMNRIRDELRRAARSPVPTELPEALEASAPSPLEQAIGKQGFERYEKALGTLKPADRDAIVARIELQQSYEEVAIALGKPNANAARMAVTRALARLIEAMQHER